ncbi:CCA tRNA nucleotidyltransferase [Thalassococcus sp. BH17M4-6]|uniref:CCA tRNA nucleotidyltransferase n=1 Tax=Thalassococcus sp. BH17M4-6 TaxID=3413148 RepID=UPI003BE46B95
MTRITDPWLMQPATQAVLGLLTDAGHQAYAVGGCVRNALLGAPVQDVDIATDALPETVTELAENAGLKAVPTGIAHGTVTVVADGMGFEVTTFRADVETDGRHAVVRFSDDLAEDARRRDFTMNALYADAQGNVIDPLKGLPDLRARKVRFIEDPAQRIAEDYLRILRFFRFNAWYADPEQGFDPEALAAIADSLDGLAGLSKERVGAETLKLLAAPDPAPAVAAMQRVGVLGRCLPGAESRALAPLVHLEHQHGMAPDPLRRLASLGVFDGAPLRLSKAQQRRIELYQSLIGAADSPGAIGFRHGAEMAKDVLLLRAAMLETPLDAGDLLRADEGAKAGFPVSAQDLMPAFKGPALGAELVRLEALWIASGFRLSRDQLLDLAAKG